MTRWYEVGTTITAWIVFVVAWIYCIAEYGFLLGVGLGWLPAGIVAVIVGLLWPLIALAMCAALLLLLRQ